LYQSYLFQAKYSEKIIIERTTKVIDNKLREKSKPVLEAMLGVLTTFANGNIVEQSIELQNKIILNLVNFKNMLDSVNR